MKQTTARVAFPGKHRLVFEAVIEYNQAGYPKDVFFAEIHEDNRVNHVIRMQLNTFGVFKFCRGIDEIIPIGEELLAQNAASNAPQKAQGEMRIFTQSNATQTALFLGAKLLPGSSGKKKLWYYINMYRDGMTYAIKFNKAELLAVKDQTSQFAQHAYAKFLEAQSAAGRTKPKQQVEIVYE